MFNTTSGLINGLPLLLCRCELHHLEVHLEVFVQDSYSRAILLVSPHNSTGGKLRIKKLLKNLELTLSLSSSQGELGCELTLSSIAEVFYIASLTSLLDLYLSRIHHEAEEFNYLYQMGDTFFAENKAQISEGLRHHPVVVPPQLASHS